jgi:hypothetical protein
MSTTIWVILGIVVIIIVYVAVKLFTTPLNDFLGKTLTATVWIWLPFRAFGRLLKEFGKKKH